MASLRRQVLALFIFLVLPAYSAAALIDIGLGAVYDTELNISLIKNAQYHGVDLSDSNRINAIYGESVKNIDGSTHLVTRADLYQIQPTRRVYGGTWWGATAWAQTLTYAGKSNWRLPTQDELIHVLEDSSFPDIFENAVRGGGVDSLLFWTSTELAASSVVQIQSRPAGSPSYYILNIDKGLDQSDRFRQVPWAVHDGDISVIPLPAAFWLFASGAMLVGVAARRRSGSA